MAPATGFPGSSVFRPLAARLWWRPGTAVGSQRRQPRGTIADGIAVTAPVAGALVLRDVRESGRGLLAVTDDDALLRAIRELASRGGVVAEPAGAAAFAGLNVALDRRLIDRDEEVVVLVTGSALKTPQFLGGRRRGDRDRGLPGGG